MNEPSKQGRRPMTMADIHNLFIEAFQKLYDWNNEEGIEPEQYRKNIETMLLIYTHITL